MKITNNSPALQGINTASGEIVYLAPGDERDINVGSYEIDHLKTLPFLGLEGVDLGASYPPVDNQPSPVTPAPTYSVKERSQGWWVIVDAGGNEATKKLRKDDVADFDAKSDDEKVAFVAANKAD